MKKVFFFSFITDKDMLSLFNCFEIKFMFKCDFYYIKISVFYQPLRIPARIMSRNCQIVS